MSTRDFILGQFRLVAEQHNKRLGSLSDSLPLLDCGLDSLCIAIVVANLDDELGLDPFDAANVDIPVTVGDFIRLYENAVT
jgi:hypothetical protein